MAPTAVPLRVDPDFAHDVLGDLYAYGRKRRAVAWLLWAALGWMGAHRFYLERPATGLAMLLTGGGVLVWWVADAWKLNGLVVGHNAEQARREAAGQPPIELSFMPDRTVDVLHEPPEWTVRWHRRGRLRRGLRLAGDVLVLMVTGAALGALAGQEGGTEAAAAVVALIAVILLGGGAERLHRIPGARALFRWSHRLRLFYYFNRPGPPPALLLRGITAILWAPFRKRDRAEVRLYLELGAVFTLGFLALDLIEDVAIPLTRSGLAALEPGRLLGLWVEEAFMTFFIIYAFAAPVGAILTLYLLTRRTHTRARVLGLFTLLFLALTSGLLG